MERLDMERMNVTSQIKAIEFLKCGLLSDVAALFESLRKPSSDEERADSLSSLIIHTYLLAKRLGLDFPKLDGEAVLKIRRDILSGGADAETEKLIKYLGRDAL